MSERRHPAHLPCRLVGRARRALTPLRPRPTFLSIFELLSSGQAETYAQRTMSTATTPQPDADARLRAALDASGQRFTEQRAAVYRVLHATDLHPTADDVFTAVRPGLPDISLATVYKALETLVACGLATKLTYGDGSARYDARTDEHVHSRCTGCGEVRDVDGTAPPRIGQVRVGDGFEVRGLRVEVIGLCARCAV